MSAVDDRTRAYVERVVAASPPLTTAQIDRIRRILRPYVTPTPGRVADKAA